MIPTLRLLASAALALAASAAAKPNFVFILADDMGWNDPGFGGGVAETPHLDRMAREGTEFRQACASAPNCAPTRACLLTGQYPPRHGVYTVVDDRHAPGSPHHRLLAATSRADLPETTRTLAEDLKGAGYRTALFGMWNLGRGRSGPGAPAGQGFETFVEPKQLGFEKDAYRNASGDYSPDVLTDAALRWLGADTARPFFLYLAFHDVHEPFDPKPALLAKYRAKGGKGDPALAATVEAMDANIGRVLAKLRELGMAEDTWVFFTSDNGGSRRTVAPLRGGKGTLYQGGIRVPALAIGPGACRRASDEVVLSMDWHPTLLELAGLPPRGDLDGISLAPLLRGTTQTLRSRDTFWHFPCYIGGGGPCSAVRSGDWKLIEFFEGGRTELYDLSKDPGELHDLSDSDPERAARLHATLRSWHDKTGAPRPTRPNPAYDPNRTPERGGPNGAKGPKPTQPSPRP